MSEVRCEVREVPPTKPEKEVVLTMPYDVAQSLRAICGNFSQFNPAGALIHADLTQIWTALRDAEVREAWDKTTAASEMFLA